MNGIIDPLYIDGRFRRYRFLGIPDLSLSEIDEDDPEPVKYMIRKYPRLSCYFPALHTPWILHGELFICRFLLNFSQLDDRLVEFFQNSFNVGDEILLSTYQQRRLSIFNYLCKKYRISRSLLLRIYYISIRSEVWPSYYEVLPFSLTNDDYGRFKCGIVEKSDFDVKLGISEKQFEHYKLACSNKKVPLDHLRDWFVKFPMNLSYFIYFRKLKNIGSYVFNGSINDTYDGTLEFFRFLLLFEEITDDLADFYDDYYMDWTDTKKFIPAMREICKMLRKICKQYGIDKNIVAMIIHMSLIEW